MESVNVSTKGCVFIHDFIEAVKNELPNQLGHYGCDQISISLTAGGYAFGQDLKLDEICDLCNIDYEHPLFITVSFVTRNCELIREVVLLFLRFGYAITLIPDTR